MPQAVPFACPSRLANEILAGLFLPLCAPMFFRARSVTSVHNPRFGYCLHDVSVRYLNALIVSSPSTYVPFRAGRFHAWSALRFHLTFAGEKKKKEIAGDRVRSFSHLLTPTHAHCRLFHRLGLERGAAGLHAVLSRRRDTIDQR